MKTNKRKNGLLFWLVLACLTTVASFLAVRIDNYLYRSYIPVNIGDKLIPYLNIDRVRKIRIDTTRKDIVRLAKKQEAWYVSSLYDYPADMEKVNGLLEELYGARIVQSVPTDNETRKQLNLFVDRGRDITGSNIVLYTKADKKLADIVVGRKRTENVNAGAKTIQLGRYVYVPDDNAIIFTDTFFNETAYSQFDWLDKTFPKIRNIRSIELSGKNVSFWKIERTAENDRFYLMDNGKKKSTELNDISKIVATLKSLNFYSVVSPAKVERKMSLPSPRIVKIHTFNGEYYTLSIGTKKDNAYYVKVNAYDNLENLDEPNPRYEKWIYIIDSKRIEPLLIKASAIIKKSSPAKDEKFALPIG